MEWVVVVTDDATYDDDDDRVAFNIVIVSALNVTVSASHAEKHMIPHLNVVLREFKHSVVRTKRRSSRVKEVIFR